MPTLAYQPVTFRFGRKTRYAAALVLVISATGLFVTSFMWYRSWQICDVCTVNLPHKITLILEFPKSNFLFVVRWNAGAEVAEPGLTTMNPSQFGIKTPLVADVGSFRGTPFNDPVGRIETWRLVVVSDRAALVAAGAAAIISCLFLFARRKKK